MYASLSFEVHLSSATPSKTMLLSCCVVTILQQIDNSRYDLDALQIGNTGYRNVYRMISL